MSNDFPKAKKKERKFISTLENFRAHKKKGDVSMYGEEKKRKEEKKNRKRYLFFIQFSFPFVSIPTAGSLFRKIHFLLQKPNSFVVFVDVDI